MLRFGEPKALENLSFGSDPVTQLIPATVPTTLFIQLVSAARDPVAQVIGCD
jgi:hypothetical protein